MSLSTSSRIGPKTEGGRDMRRPGAREKRNIRGAKRQWVRPSNVFSFTEKPAHPHRYIYRG
jgi:hypothetical protein